MRHNVAKTNPRILYHIIRRTLIFCYQLIIPNRFLFIFFIPVTSSPIIFCQVIHHLQHALHIFCISILTVRCQRLPIVSFLIILLCIFLRGLQSGHRCVSSACEYGCAQQYKRPFFPKLWHQSLFWPYLWLIAFRKILQKLTHAADSVFFQNSKPFSHAFLCFFRYL